MPGIAIGLNRQFALNVFLGITIGKFTRYSDTMHCAHFRFGACGGGYGFGYVVTSFGVSLRWN